MPLEVDVSIAARVKARLQSIGEAVHAAYSNAVPGDISEFGTGGGDSFEAIAATMRTADYLSNKYNTPTKRLFGFDSFQGFPKANLKVDIDSPMVKSGTWGEGRGGSLSELEIRRRGEQYISTDRINLYSGWFIDTLPLIPHGTKFAIVHLDCDLYESTIQVLDYLFSNHLLSDGCQLLFDDFLENRFSKKMGQRKAWEECKQKYSVDFTDIGFYGRVCWRCVIHID